MKRDPNDESAVLIVYICGLAIIAMLAFFSIKIMQERKADCEASHGVYHFDRRGGICLAKDVVIKP